MATKTNDIATKTEQVNLTNPSDIMAFATNLKELIVQNKLFTDIRGKNYVNVEGWQIAGAFTGVFPIVEKVENLSEGNFYKYRAEVTLRDKNNNIVGSGMAICTNKEAGKTRFDEYAVASMAQTRAVGKAFRMKIGWLLKIAGYETTPAEEMPVEGQVVENKTDNGFEKLSSEAKLWEITDGKKMTWKLRACHDLKALEVLWKTVPEELRDKYQPRFKNRKDELQNA